MNNQVETIKEQIMTIEKVIVSLDSNINKITVEQMNAALKLIKEFKITRKMYDEIIDTIIDTCEVILEKKAHSILNDDQYKILLNRLNDCESNADILYAEQDSILKRILIILQ